MVAEHDADADGKISQSEFSPPESFFFRFYRQRKFFRFL
jgi:hypothetical protein